MTSSVRVGPAVLVLLVAASAAGQSTTRVSVSSAEVQGNLASLHAAISANGRFIAFTSAANNLVPGDVNSCTDVFVRDVQNGTTELASVNSAGTLCNGISGEYPPSISADGRFVAFTSNGSNLVAGDVPWTYDVFVHDRLTGITECACLTPAGALPANGSARPVLSGDGRYVAFLSGANDLVAVDTNNVSDVFVRDRLGGTTELVSVDSNGVQANSGPSSACITPDGRFVAWDSAATNLVANDGNASSDVFVHDRLTGITECASLDSGGVFGNAHSFSPSISADGRYVAFSSQATNLVAGDTNGVIDAFVHDRLTGSTERVSVSSTGVQAEYDCWGVISADGQRVLLTSGSAKLAPGDTNLVQDVFEHDRASGVTQRISLDSSGAQVFGSSTGFGLDSDGRFAVFQSVATSLVPGDSNACGDIFVREVWAVAPGVDLCQPGAAGVIACPCSNPALQAPAGCDNASGTGGARLMSSGTCSTGFDSLVFSTAGERTTATSILLQGDAVLPAGTVFGQGVRCVGGALRRLYTKNAVGGAITAPQASDPHVWVRSAALGDPILPGTSRWYAVYYRDPNVLGSCPSTSTFNITQTQRIDWQP